MSRLLPLAASMALLGGCATAAGGGGDGAWLVGTWVEDRAACAGSDNAIRYLADGTYAFENEAGRWSLRGERLSTEQTRPTAGARASLRVARTGENTMLATYPNGESHSFFRC